MFPGSTKVQKQPSEVFYKKGVLKISQENTGVGVSFLIKLQV